MKLLVTGGTGFIGQAVCRAAVEAGHEVVSLGRRGRPGGAAAWMDRVAWVAADVLRPEDWRTHLDGCGAVVHCVGIVLEHPGRGITYERINGDAAVVAAGEAARAGVPAFVFLSASQQVPGIPREYLAAKRRAEAAILAAPVRGVVLRPGFVYGAGRLVSVPAAAVMRLGLLLPPVHRRFGPSRPVPVDALARAVLRAATDGVTSGIVEMDGIERMGGG